MSTEPVVTESVVKELAKFLKTNMPDIQEAFAEFPAANQTLKMPCLSVITRNQNYTGINPYVVSKVLPQESPAPQIAKVMKAVGIWVITLQVDIWAAYKPKREQLIQQLIRAFNQNMDVPGISLKLGSYFDEWVRFSLSGEIQKNGDEEGSQRGEWRAIATITCDCRQIEEYVAPVITTIENTVETPNSIAAPDEEDEESII